MISDSCSLSHLSERSSSLTYALQLSECVLQIESLILYLYLFSTWLLLLQGQPH